MEYLNVGGNPFSASFDRCRNGNGTRAVRSGWGGRLCNTRRREFGTKNKDEGGRAEMG